MVRFDFINVLLNLLFKYYHLLPAVVVHRGSCSGTAEERAQRSRDCLIGSAYESGDFLALG